MPGSGSAPQQAQPAPAAVAWAGTGVAAGRAVAQSACRVGAGGLALVDEVVAIPADSGRLPAGLPEPAAGGAAPAGGAPRAGWPWRCVRHFSVRGDRVPRSGRRRAPRLRRRWGAWQGDSAAEPGPGCWSRGRRERWRHRGRPRSERSPHQGPLAAARRRTSRPARATDRVGHASSGLLVEVVAAGAMPRGSHRARCRRGGRGARASSRAASWCARSSSGCRGRRTARGSRSERRRPRRQQP